jgi:hypothetical protein
LPWSRGLVDCAGHGITHAEELPSVPESMIEDVRTSCSQAGGLERCVADHTEIFVERDRAVSDPAEIDEKTDARCEALIASEMNRRGFVSYAKPAQRAYFGEQLRSQRTDAWKECNRRLFDYYRTLAPHLPNSFREMEPLFLAVICGCNAGLFREALHEVYLPRIQRGECVLRC